VVIEVDRHPPAVIVNGLRIETAPPIANLLAVIGTPTRIDTGPKPAPPGFRNNQQHVFDSLGVHVNEHHHTRRAQAIGVALSVEERRYGFTPTSAFAGSLLFDGVEMPQRIRIYGCEITASNVVTDKLIRFGLDSIEGRLSFFEDGRYPHGAEKYTCGITIAITQGGRTGLSLSHIECWPHDPSRERRRAGAEAAQASWFARLNDLLH
jgi:hypothetical protein